MKEGSLPSSVEARASEILQFKDLLSTADGRYLALSSAPLGRPLFLTARNYAHPFSDFGSESVRVGLTPNDSILLLSVHDVPDQVSEPVGFIDWEIRGNTGIVQQWHGSHGQIHRRVMESIDKGDLSEWISMLGFEVRSEAEHKGVGSLLFAASLSALQAVNVESIRASYGSVTNPAKALWATFGVAEEMHERRRKIPLSEIIHQPKIDKAIARFLP